MSRKNLKEASNQKTPSVPRFFTPRNTLKAKVGFGGVDQALIKRSQEVIDNNNFDFRPIALGLVDAFSDTLVQALTLSESDSGKESELMGGLIVTALKIKADSGMFGYTLLSQVAGVLLLFAEDVVEVTQDTFAVLQIYKKTMDMILARKLKASDSTEAKILLAELMKANSRYFSKYPKRVK